MLPLPPHLPISLLKVYVQQFLLPGTSSLAIKKKITWYNKRQKAHFKDTEQTSEPDMAESLELPHWEFKTTTIHMLSL